MIKPGMPLRGNRGVSTRFFYQGRFDVLFPGPFLRPRLLGGADDEFGQRRGGSIMTRNGSCYKCENCGSTSGCS